MSRSQAQCDEEKTIFGAFYKLAPEFAREPLKGWQLAEQDPPDIVCTTVSGRRIGVELVEWLHHAEMCAGKSSASIERQALDAIGEPQPTNRSSHFDMVILYPRNRALLGRGDKGPFRVALLSFIADIDTRWPIERRWHHPPGCRIVDLSQWPILDKHLKSAHFNPGQSQWAEGINWILPAAPFFMFDDTTMIEPLKDVLRCKIQKYRGPMATPCDEYVLLAFFNQGLMYNPPIRTPRRPIEVTVNAIRGSLPTDRGPFAKGYLFLAPTPGSQAFPLW